jgi:hypothetical protein
MRIRTLSVIAVALALVLVARAADKGTWTGTLVDVYCYLQDDSNVGNEHSGMKTCGTDCLRNGRPAGLLTPDKKFYILVAPSPALAKYVGEPIRVTGQMINGTIVADKVEVKKGDKWETIDIQIKGMM